VSLRKFVSVLIIGSVLFIPIVYAEQLPNKINQDTYGNQSPASIALPGSTVNINYQTSYKEITEVIEKANNKMRNEFSNCLKVAAKLQTSTLDELGEELALILLKDNKTTSVEAEGWAKSIIDNSQPIKNTQEHLKETSKKYNEEIAKMFTMNTYRYMSYILSYIDKRITSLQRVDDRITLEKSNKIVFFYNVSKLEKPYPIRRIFLPDGNHIEIICSPGQLRNGLVHTLPFLTFNEIKHDNIVQQFKFTADSSSPVFLGSHLPYKKKELQYKNIIYPMTGGPDLDEKIKKQFSETFIKFFQLAYATQ
jgi:hypothetical protein